ncbi:MAG TPA: flagellar assembly protein FliW [Candidatus Avamphibacillus sp.]|nr:flagellar assembly protein FliW [Candidatus Avamphibacillus sp.]
MEIQTKYLGEVQIDESNIIQFSNGLPGFHGEKQFVLLELPGNPVFQILQSVVTKDIAFILTNPYHFYQDYTFELDDSVLESLLIQTKEEVAVFTIVTLKQPFKTSTINLKAPVIINSQKKCGKQLILNNDEYPTKASITPEKTTQLEGE